MTSKIVTIFIIVLIAAVTFSQPTNEHKRDHHILNETASAPVPIKLTRNITVINKEDRAISNTSNLANNDLAEENDSETATIQTELCMEYKSVPKLIEYTKGEANRYWNGVKLMLGLLILLIFVAGWNIYSLKKKPVYIVIEEHSYNGLKAKKGKRTTLTDDHTLPRDIDEMECGLATKPNKPDILDHKQEKKVEKTLPCDLSAIIKSLKKMKQKIYNK